MLSGGRYLAVLVVVAVLVTGGLITYELYAPERTTTVDEDLPAAAEVLSSGDFEGAGEYRVSGTVSVFEDEEGYGLYFEEYQQDQGPEVYVYLAHELTSNSSADVESGRKVRIDRGEDEGESTVEGNFVQRLPGDVNVSEYEGVVVWDARLNESYGAATLEPVE